MKFPSIKDVASDLRKINQNVEGPCDVRLQVYPSGGRDWIVRFGSPDYDQDHRGYWGCGAVPGVVNGKAINFNSRDLARSLIEQAKEQYSFEIAAEARKQGGYDD